MSDPTQNPMYQMMMYNALMGGGQQGAPTSSMLGAAGNVASPILRAMMMQRMAGMNTGTNPANVPAAAGGTANPAIGTSQVTPYWQGMMGGASGQPAPTGTTPGSPFAQGYMNTASNITPGQGASATTSPDLFGRIGNWFNNTF